MSALSLRLPLFPLAVLPLAAAYTYTVTDPFTSISSIWTSNGTIAGSALGLVGPGAGGSAIYNQSVTAEYEVKATFRIAATGGSFVLFSRASTNAQHVPGGTAGTYYAVEFTPTVSGGGGCSMLLSYYKRVSNVLSLLGQQGMACQDNMWVRMAQGPNFLLLATNLNEIGFIADSSIGSGQPGFGAYGTPSGNAIGLGQIGPDDATSPVALPAGSVRSAVFDNRVDLEWPGMVDDANGSGLLMYQIFRNGVFRGNFRYPNWSDATVAPGTSYTYYIQGLDHHHNASGTSVTVVTPAAGIKDPRRVGVKPLGSYWGASPESIDTLTGNLSFSLPTVTAQGRGGMAIPLRLSYNSQNWRKDPGGVWKLGTDVGFGWGWKMLPGALCRSTRTGGPSNFWLLASGFWLLASDRERDTDIGRLRAFGGADAGRE